ncbi:GNAT family N-acetyltransferase [Hymenobacter saemangeumensis]|uniref:GNAT family N-acetyltransferase n=1 Tax=Hymenobacter saemangeumensis TaxID=1084522 RepID=A0ABP8I7J2_9BACT
MLYADLSLAQKLERTEARGNAAFVETRARLLPESGACWREVAGAYAMFDGPDSPLTQTFGLGVFEEVTAGHLQELEAFFQERGAPVLHEVSPLAAPSLLPLLTARGYQPIEYTTLLFQSISAAEMAAVPEAAALRTRIAGPEEAELWARTAAAGWSTEGPDLAEFIFDFGQISARSALSFLAEHEGRPVATGALIMHDGVALLAGASTVPEARGQGAQAALLDARLRHAAARGCGIACMGALPGSQSQRNAEKQGFRVAYTRTKWQLMR